MRLSEIKTGDTVYVSRLDGSISFRRRLQEMGFVCGQEVTCMYASPLGTPIVYAMLGQKVALRRGEAAQISVEFTMDAAEAYAASADEDTPHEAQPLPFRAHRCGGNCSGCTSCGSHVPQIHRKNSVSEEKDVITVALVGNPNCGKTAFFNAACGGHERTGNYAGVTVSSVEGRADMGDCTLKIVDLPGTYSLNAFSPEEAFVANELAKGEAEVIINVIDVTNLERNLLLTMQLKEMGLPIVGVLNMYDEFRDSESELDIAALSSRLGLPLVPTVARLGDGVPDVLAAAVAQARAVRSKKAAAVAGDTAAAVLQSGGSLGLAGVAKAATGTSPCESHREIHRLLDGIYKYKESKAARNSTAIDRIFARSPFAYVLFFLLLGLIFYVTFEIGAYPMDWMETGVEWLSEAVSSRMSPGWMRDLLVNGVLGGVGSVIVFLPNILILYFFISVLEDSGYLARAALLADPLLRRVGLHGKSFIPMLMGFGCNVPAVMATRTIESRKSRLITMMTLPFMSCSARLPVYVVLAGAFFPSHAAWVMLGLYALGIVVSFVSAGILSRVFHRSEESHFVMEIPPYRRPVLLSVGRHTWEKGRQYLRKMGGIILVASIVVWALGYFPVNNNPELTQAEQQEQSYLGQIGHALSPVISPLGYDWRLGVGILSGVGAKELMVSTLGVLYNVPAEEGGDPSEATLKAALRHSGITDAAALSYLVFALLYFPCLATIAAIKGESGRWKYALFTAAYTTGVAYVLAFAVYRVALILL